jgi:hypothetical protein
MQNLNASETVLHLQQAIKKEVDEMLKLQESIRSKETDESEKKMEIPQLQKKLETDKHDIYQDERDIPKLKSKLAELQREKLRLQGEIMSAQKAIQDGMQKTH